MTINNHFPSRPRRLRRGSLIRDAVANVHLSPSDLIYPLFVTSAKEITPVESMPGVNQLPVSDAIETIERLAPKGLRQFILFGVTAGQHKDAAGQYARDDQAPVNQLLQEVRSNGLDVLMYADLCFCEYTDHGHCGVLHSADEPAKASQWVVDNDQTLEILGKTAVAQAEYGADVVAPSGMMDGQVGAIRQALDKAGHEHVAILSYSVKYASDFYGPFRDAGEGAMQFGDRRGYQMDYRRDDEWRTELQGDLAQGADMVMVKPASTYLDIIHQVRSSCSVPVVGYHVSGEYAMLHAAAEKGWLDLRATAIETTYAIKRAGADLVITYFAPQLLDWLSE
jgi:porphobilinogen synthase